MIKEIFLQLKTALLLLLFLIIMTGVIYPSIITIAGQFLFPWQANGSLLTVEHKMIGSELIGQSFTDPRYFWGRPSATQPYPYNALASSGSNDGPNNEAFIQILKARVASLTNNINEPFIPVDLITASGSGLDPDISPVAAYYQIPRIAKLRHLQEKTIYTLVQANTQRRLFFFLGEQTVNVLKLNLALDKLTYEKNIQ